MRVVLESVVIWSGHLPRGINFIKPQAMAGIVSATAGIQAGMNIYD